MNKPTRRTAVRYPWSVFTVHWWFTGTKTREWQGRSYISPSSILRCIWDSESSLHYRKRREPEPSNSTERTYWGCYSRRRIREHRKSVARHRPYSAKCSATPHQPFTSCRRGSLCTVQIPKVKGGLQCGYSWYCCHRWRSNDLCRGVTSKRTHWTKEDVDMILQPRRRLYIINIILHSTQLLLLSVPRPLFCLLIRFVFPVR